MKKLIFALIITFTALSQTACVIREKLPYESSESSDSSEDAVPVTSPDDARTVGDHIIKNKDNGVEIERYIGSPLTAEIPEEIDGLPVVSIGKEAFAELKELKSVTLPDSVLEIGDDAFSDCRELESITLPKNLAKIGKRAFADCVMLDNITLPQTLKTIDMYAFYNCYILKSITIPSGVTRIAKGTFFNCSELSSVTLPKTLTAIETDAFYNCFELRSIELPDSLTDIGRRPFEGCFNLDPIVYKGKEYTVWVDDDDYDHADIIEAVTGVRPESSDSE